MGNVYDVIIIGGGPAGLTAGLYSARAKKSTLILEKEKTGGQITSTSEIANYPGSKENVSGTNLTDRMAEQAKEFGAEIKIDGVVSVDFSDKIKTVKCENEEYKTRAVIIASGATPRKLGVPGEEEFTGRGVAYCATCDADFFNGLEIFVIGGGDSAVEEGIYLTKFGRKVTIVHRREELKAAKSIQEKAFNNPKIEFMWNTEVAEIKGEGVVNSIVFKNRETGELTEYKASEEDMTFGIFPYVGYLPLSEIYKGKVDMDDVGYIIADENMKTNVEGVFVAGDIRQKSLRQVVTATADGAIAAVQAEKYIDDNFEI